MKQVYKFSLLILLIVLFFLAQNGIKSYSGQENYLNDSIHVNSHDSLFKIADSLLHVQKQLAEGKALYEKKCQKCHILYLPKDYRLKQWKENLNEMKEKAELTQNEYKLILGYLSKNCKK